MKVLSFKQRNPAKAGFFGIRIRSVLAELPTTSISTLAVLARQLALVLLLAVCFSPFTFGVTAGFLDAFQTQVKPSRLPARRTDRFLVVIQVDRVSVTHSDDDFELMPFDFVIGRQQLPMVLTQPCLSKSKSSPQRKSLEAAAAGDDMGYMPGSSAARGSSCGCQLASRQQCRQQHLPHIAERCASYAQRFEPRQRLPKRR